VAAFNRPADTFGTFVKGYRYRVRRELSFDAVPNDILVFVEGGQFSAYDDSWIYTFRRESDNAEVRWFLNADPRSKSLARISRSLVLPSRATLTATPLKPVTIARARFVPH
jgi:hypothetical protein